MLQARWRNENGNRLRVVPTFGDRLTNERTTRRRTRETRRLREARGASLAERRDYSQSKIVTAKNNRLCESQKTVSKLTFIFFGIFAVIFNTKELEGHFSESERLTNYRRTAHEKDSLSRSAQMLVPLRTEFVIRLEFSTAFSKILSLAYLAESSSTHNRCVRRKGDTEVCGRYLHHWRPLRKARITNK